MSRVTATISDVGEYSRWLKMADMPYTFPVIEKERYISTPGDPVPIMGNSLVVYKTPEDLGFLNFRFWAGVNYHRKSLREAKEALDNLMPKNSVPLTDFDMGVRHWRYAKLPLGKVSTYKSILKKDVF
jgi:hypothetical protein